MTFNIYLLSSTIFKPHTSPGAFSPNMSHKDIVRYLWRSWREEIKDVQVYSVPVHNRPRTFSLPGPPLQTSSCEGEGEADRTSFTAGDLARPGTPESRNICCEDCCVCGGETCDTQSAQPGDSSGSADLFERIGDWISEGYRLDVQQRETFRWIEEGMKRIDSSIDELEAAVLAGYGCELAEVGVSAFTERVKPVKEVVDGDHCFDRVLTLCEGTSTTVDREICNYYMYKSEDVTAPENMNIFISLLAMVASFTNQFPTLEAHHGHYTSEPAYHPPAPANHELEPTYRTPTGPCVPDCVHMKKYLPVAHLSTMDLDNGHHLDRTWTNDNYVVPASQGG